jgi:peptide/nickel transport system permease protein
MAIQPDSSLTPGLPPGVRGGLSRVERARAAGRSVPLVSAAAWLVVASFIVAAVFAPLLAPDRPNASGATPLLAMGSAGHLLGTDSFGHDELSRALYGARPLIVTCLASVALAVVAGFLIGLIAGYAGGWLDAVCMRTMDAVLSFPLILLAIMVVAALGPGVRNVVIAISVSQVPVFARLVRALTAREVSREYVLAARAGGFRTRRILFREITPNVLGPVIVQATSVIAVAAGYAAALSYLGLGAQPPQSDWGYMVKDGQEFIFSRPSLALIPGILITVFVTAVNFVGDDVRDLVDVGSRD